MVGLEWLIPSAENCNKFVFFEGDKFYAVPDQDTTALATCSFLPHSDALLVFIALHGVLTPDLAVAFCLWFIPHAVKYKAHHSHFRVIIHNYSKLQSHTIKNQLQCLPLCKRKCNNS